METKKVLCKRLISFLVIIALVSFFAFQLWMLWNKTLLTLLIIAVCLFFTFREIKRAPVEPELH